MRTQLLILFSSLVAVHSASVMPVDHSSSSSVKVNQNGNEYSYTIKEGKAIGLLPIIPIIEPANLNGKPGQPILISSLKKDDIKENEKIEIQDKDGMKLLEPDQSKPKLEEDKPKSNELTSYELKGRLKQNIKEYQIIPGYRLIPANDVLLEYPYYHPHLYDYAYHYPHIRLF